MSSTIRRSLFALLAVAACTNDPVPPDLPRPVRTLVIGGDTTANTSTTQRARYDGTFVPRTDVMVGFQVPGRITERLVDVGQRAQAGTPLARLDLRDLTLAVEGARAALNAADAEAKTAVADLERARALHAQDIITDAALERTETAAAGVTARREDARVRLASAENALRYGTLVAPTSGVVTAIAAEIGQVVAPGQPVVALAREGDVEVAIDVPERHVERFGVGMEARVFALATGNGESPSAPWRASVREVAPAADPVTGTYRVKVSVRVPTGASPKLGQTASVAITASDDAQHVIVPASALVQTHPTPGVWILPPGKAQVQFRPVSVARFGDGEVHVRSGLEHGDEIVTAGVNRLDSLMVVRRWEAGAR